MGMNKPLKPTVDDIVKYVLEYERGALRSIGKHDFSLDVASQKISSKHDILRNATIGLMLKIAPHTSAIHFAGAHISTDAYSLVSKAYDTLVREHSSLDGEVRGSFRQVPTTDELMLNTFCLEVLEEFLATSPRPKTVILPVCGAEYGLLLENKNKVKAHTTLSMLLPEKYIIRDLKIEKDSDALSRQYLGWQRPVGEVRVEFGVRE